MADLPFDMSPDQAADLHASGAVELIDVRETYEREAGHVPGSRHVELSALTGAAGDLPSDRPLVFLCRVGARSSMAAFAFRRAGFDAHNLEGGIVGWVASGHAIEGRIAEH